MQDRFVYTFDFEAKIEKALSKERLDAYSELFGTNNNSFNDIIKLYNANTAISEALFGSIQIAEISVRNSIHGQFIKKFGNEWYLYNKIGLDSRGKSTIDGCVRKYINIKRKDGSGLSVYDTPEKLGSKVVSEMTFGFWTSLFQCQYEDPLWRKTLRNAFPHVGGVLTRGNVSHILNKIRHLRNRIGHHEQILRYDLDKLYNDIITTVMWVSPVTAIWLSHHNRFYEVKDSLKDEFSMINVGLIG